MTEELKQLDDMSTETFTPPDRQGALPDLKDQLPPTLVMLLEWLSRIALVGFVLSLAYLISIVASGQDKAYAALGTGDRLILMRNIGYAVEVLSGCGIYLAVYAFIVYYEVREFFIGMAVLFAAFEWGIKLVFIDLLARWSYPALWITGGTSLLAKALLAVVLLRLVCAVGALMKYGVGRALKDMRKQASNAKVQVSQSRTYKRPIYRLSSRCWELPYCRDYLLKVCPAWHKKKTCWKYGSGCLCDSGMVERLVQIELTSTASRTAPAMQVPKGPQKCHTCQIYLSHEEEKFRLLSPLIPVAGLIVLVVYWTSIVDIYDGIAGKAGTLVGQLVVGPARSNVTDWAQTMKDPIVEYFLIIFCAVAIVSYILKFLEWAILEKKL